MSEVPATQMAPNRSGSDSLKLNPDVLSGSIRIKQRVVGLENCRPAYLCTMGYVCVHVDPLGA